MSLKSEVSNRYLEQMKMLHGYKKTSPFINAFITGDLRDNSIGEAIRHSIEGTGGSVKSLDASTDIRQEDSDLINEIQPGANTLIMCHGVSHLDWFEDCPAEKMKEIMDVNVLGTMLMTQAFVRYTMMDRCRKTIIMIGSMAHKAVLNGSVAYCASKAAVAHLARCLAWELAPKGFDVFCIHPSNTLGTPMSEETIAGLQRYRKLSHQGATEYWNDTMLRSSSLTTDEIAELVMFLCSGKAQYLSGAQLELAGGQR